MTVNDMARAALPIAVFFTVIPGLLLLAERPGTAGFVITVCTLVLGAVFLAITLVALRFPRPPIDQ